MQNYNNPNLNLQQPQMNMMNGMMGQQQMQSPYGGNNMLLSNNPYSNYNYMGNRRDSQDLLSNQFLKCRDITEMIKDASPEERATLHQKMTTLASKIA